MKHTGGDVGAHVGVETRALNGGSEVVVEPTPVTLLRRGQPAKGGPRLFDAAGHGQGHGGLHVIPRVGMSPDEPRYLSTGSLQVGQILRGAVDLRSRQYSRYSRQGIDAIQRATSGLRK